MPAVPLPLSVDLATPPSAADAASPSPLAAEAARLDARLRGASPLEIIAAGREAFGQNITAVSSFGTESTVLLHMIAEVDPNIPVIFLDTGHLFPETLAYRDDLIARLGLTGVRSIEPDAAAVKARDQDNALWAEDTDACCALRKVEPLDRALAPFSAWINGRKRYQAETRASIPVVEVDGTRLKFNPLADLDRAAIEAYMTAHALPRHPLEAHGFLSVGCMPCTSRVKPGEDPRAGRWRGQAKTECGIHVRRM